MRVCAADGCDVDLTGRRASQRYCSRRCSPTPVPSGVLRRRPDRVCPTCGSSFRPGRNEQRYCSRPCIPTEVLTTARRGPVPERRCQRHDPEDRVPTKGGTSSECRGCREERQVLRREAEKAHRAIVRAEKAQRDAEWSAVFREHGLLP